MIEKLDVSLDELLKNKRIKAKWSEIESYGIIEMIHILFKENVDYDSIAHSILVENNTVCLHLYDGISFRYNDDYYRFIKIYIDSEDNIIFLTVSKDVFIFETSKIDGEDLKYYVGGD